MNTILLENIEDLQRHLGEHLRRLRLSADLDQLTLAERAGVSEKALRNLENGRGSTVGTLLQVVRALDALRWLDALAPAASISPMALLQQRPEPQRVSRPRGKRQAKEGRAGA